MSNIIVLFLLIYIFYVDFNENGTVRSAVIFCWLFREVGLFVFREPVAFTHSLTPCHYLSTAQGLLMPSPSLIDIYVSFLFIKSTSLHAKRGYLSEVLVSLMQH